MGASTALSSPHIHKKEEVCMTNAAIKEKEELGTRGTQGFCDTKIPAGTGRGQTLPQFPTSEEAWEHPWSHHLGLGPKAGSACCLFKGLKQEACEGDKCRRPKSQKKLECRDLIKVCLESLVLLYLSGLAVRFRFGISRKERFPSLPSILPSWVSSIVPEIQSILTAS